VKFLLFLALLLPLKAQTSSINVTSTINIQATSSGGNVLNCTISATSTKLSVISSCIGFTTQTLDVSKAGESVTYSLSYLGNIITGVYTQSAPVGTLGFSITANGSTAVTGNF
jgi:hypothetical protein